MTWLLLSLLGFILIVLAIFYFVYEAKSSRNKALRTTSLVFDLIFSFGSGIILFGFLLIIIGLAKATGS
ncbi:hypothetical protein [Heyndrickxia oleronia]|uniref:hypothetical protein n=1 Tax=Heyndrickxia oleronia TaxID=38875 RepID=UPI001C0EDEEF|nr:hypothetical protein [Heyndrickxia oleronia]MBU5211202.1 hypothetical protein [Heyndrickxia oleronia]